jgi:hypothetical protein
MQVLNNYVALLGVEVGSPGRDGKVQSPSGGCGVRVRDAGRSQRMCKGVFQYEEYIQF